MLHMGFKIENKERHLLVLDLLQKL